MVCVKWQVQGTHLVTRKNPRTEHKMDQGRAETQNSNWESGWKWCTASQWLSLAGASAQRPGEKQVQPPTGSVLFPQQGSCHLLLHDGTVPRTGPGTRRVSVKASTRCRPDETRNALGHVPVPGTSAAVPENSPPPCILARAQ